VLAITLLLIFFSCYCYRWAAFREAALDVSSLMAHIINCNSSTLDEKHIGGGIYICVSPDTVHLLKCWQELHKKDSVVTEIILSFEEFWHLCSLITIIDRYHPTLSEAKPCYRDISPDLIPQHEQNCAECSPFQHSNCRCRLCRP